MRSTAAGGSLDREQVADRPPVRRVFVGFAGVALLWNLLWAGLIVVDEPAKGAVLVGAFALLPLVPLALRGRRRAFRATAGLGVLAYLALTPTLFFYMVYLLPPIVLLSGCAWAPEPGWIPSRGELLKVLAALLFVIALSAVALTLPGVLR